LDEVIYFNEHTKPSEKPMSVKLLFAKLGRFCHVLAFLCLLWHVLWQVEACLWREVRQFEHFRQFPLSNTRLL